MLFRTGRWPLPPLFLSLVGCVCRLVYCARSVSQWMLKQPRSRSNEDPFFFLTTTHILFLAKQRIIHFQVPKSFLCVSWSSIVFLAPNVSPSLSFLSFYLCAIAVNVCLCALPRRIFSHCLLHHIALLPLAVAAAPPPQQKVSSTRRPSCDPPPSLAVSGNT